MSSIKTPEFEDPDDDDCNYNFVSRLETVVEEVEDVQRRTSISLTLTPVTRWV